MPKFSSYLCIIFLNLYATGLSAQFPGSGRGIPQSSQNTQSDTDLPDTTIYEFSYVENIYKKYIFKDTVLYDELINPLASPYSNRHYANLGNSGSALLSLKYDPIVQLGFHSGLDQYRPYMYTLNNLRIFNQNRPISDLFFSQFLNQQNLTVGANFSRSFDSGLSLSLNYKRISQLGIYSGQKTKVTNLGISVKYTDKSEKYDAIFTFIQNANEEENNGGLVTGTDILTESVRTVINTSSQNANTRHQQQQFVLSNYYFLKGSAKTDWKLYLQNQTEFNPSYFKFSDEGLIRKEDTTLYGQWLIDSRGIRKYLQINNLRNSFFISSNSESGINIKAGLVYDHFSINDNPINRKRNDLTLTFEGNLPVFKNLIVNTQGRLGVGQNVGNFDLNGSVNLNVLNNAKFGGNVRIFRSEQSYSSQHLVLNNQILYETALDKSFGSSLKAFIDIPNLRFYASLSQHLWNNPVYWNNLIQPTQFNGLLSTTQLEVMQNIKVSNFYLENTITLQLFSENLYNLPKIISQHQLYWKGKIFRNVMELQTGIAARLIPEYNAAGYSPLWGQFYASDTSLPFFPAADLYLLAKVSAFRAVIKLENAGNFFNNKGNFDVVGYPQFDTALRFGIRWILKD